MNEREYESLCSALASTRMEGFDVTEQTERDCVRLLTGEISVEDLVEEILARPVERMQIKLKKQWIYLCDRPTAFFVKFGRLRTQ